MQSCIPYLLPAVIIAGLLCIITRGRDGRHGNTRSAVAMEAQAQFYMGRYLAGFPGLRNASPLVFCTVTENDFVFTRGRRGREIGRIPRATINLINIAPRSQILGYITVRDVIACEQVIPPASKRNKNYCLVVDWDDADGAPHNSIFEFMDKGDKTSAQHAVECLEQWKKTRTFTVPEAGAAFSRAPGPGGLQMDKLFFLSAASMVCVGMVLSLPARAEDATYALIVNKNLFSPNRTAWFMTEAQKKTQNIPQNVLRIDSKKVQLIGTVITAKRRRALISTSSRSSRKDTEMYTTGDYFQGYLVKEIEPKKVVLVNQALNDECTLMLNADKPQRSREKTALPPPARTVARRQPPRIKAETTRDLQTRMKYARNVLKQRESPLVRKQVDRDFRKLQQHFGSMSAQEQQEIILLKKEIDRMRTGRK